MSLESNPVLSKVGCAVRPDEKWRHTIDGESKLSVHPDVDVHTVVRGTLDDGSAVSPTMVHGLSGESITSTDVNIPLITVVGVA